MAEQTRSPERLSVLVVDDHEVVHWGFRLMLTPLQWVERCLSAKTGREALVLDLLAAVPAGKLAIADLPLTTPHEVKELEHAGCDAVIVHARDLSPLVGGPPPEV